MLEDEEFMTGIFIGALLFVGVILPIIFWVGI